MKRNRVLSMLAVLVLAAFSLVGLTGMSWAADVVPPAQVQPVESIPGRMTIERIRDEQAFAARAGAFSSTSDILRETRLGASAPTSYVSTSDVLRDAQLGASDSGTFVSTSDVLREQHLGANAAATQSAPAGLHEEGPGPMGRPSGR